MSVVDEAELVRLYRNEQWSLADLAERFGWSPGVIRYVLVQLGVSIRTPWERHAVTCSTDEVRRLYVDEGLGLDAVAARLACSQGVVRRSLLNARVHAPNR